MRTSSEHLQFVFLYYTESTALILTCSCTLSGKDLARLCVRVCWHNSMA